ncbi:fungal specific transcription factor domain-containing protein [Aspergillus stella-maris]|uniref:fungal specific transcription factor domain-containing protein n=1 Tax=Aspergillus stella-maris TaxID=1810926 RepID=UPI003CCD8923
MSFLLNIKASPPTNANDADIHEDAILQTSSPHHTQPSLMHFKLRLFKLPAKVCSHISGPSKLDQAALQRLDTAIAEEERLWDATYLVNGLYLLLLHQPFHNPQSPDFLPMSRDRCIKSSPALLTIHRHFYELPRLRHFKWLVNGMTSLNALHGAVALASCLLGMPGSYNPAPHLEELHATVSRMKTLQHRSPVCAKSYPIIQHLQNQLSTIREVGHSILGDSGDLFEDWIEGFEWFNCDPANLHIWDGILNQNHVPT